MTIAVTVAALLLIKEISLVNIPGALLNNGIEIPQLGFGVFKVDPAEAERAVSDALEAGYRHIDTAMIYRNEEGVGRAIANSGIPREELFITTKLWGDSHGRHEPKDAVRVSLDKLGLDYVDLYLIHWPMPKQDKYVDTWLAMQEIYGENLTRAIGVSNFLEHHLTKLLQVADIVPAVNQIELHPLLQQRPLREFGESRGIRTEAWGPLGQNKYDLTDIAVLRELAEKYNKSVHQVVIRWHLQEEIIVFPKTVSAERMKQNIDVFDFSLTDADMDLIDGLNKDLRVGTHPDEQEQ